MTLSVRKRNAPFENLLHPKHFHPSIMVQSAAKKRASPGADVEKNPLAAVELSDEDARKLQEVQKDIARVELVLERRAQQALVSVYEKRRAVAKSISKYWPVALLNHSMFSFYAQHNTDQAALSHLEDVFIVRNSVESRAFTIEFYFKENPFFTDKVLRKEYKYVPPPGAEGEKADENGITESMLDFTWERDIQPSATQINWKDPEMALTKLHPRIEDTEDEDSDIPVDGGSLFNLFEIASDPFDLGMLIANEIYPEATDYFLGQAGRDEIDSDDEEEEEDDDEADEIDLEKPQTKKHKRA
jgi:template-activating factor I